MLIREEVEEAEEVEGGEVGEEEGEVEELEGDAECKNRTIFIRYQLGFNLKSQ